MLTPQSNTTLEAIAECIRDHQTFAICGHVHPDGDCLGAQLALEHGLRTLGKQVTGLLASEEPIEGNLRFLPGIDGLVPGKDFDEDVEVFIAVDVPNTDRLKTGATAHDRAGLRITIDHHASDTCMAELNYVDPDSPSASDLVWELLKILDATGKDQALCVLTGIMTDTGRFSYQNTNSDCLVHAAETLELGADPTVVAREFFQSRSIPSMKLEQITLNRMKFFCDGAFVFSYLKDEDFVQQGAIRDDAEVLIDILRGIAGVRVALILKESGNGEVRGSLRAKDDTDVEQIARTFGGGGHKAAAGFTFKGSVFEACEQVPTEIIARCFPEVEDGEIACLKEFLNAEKAQIDG